MLSNIKRIVWKGTHYITAIFFVKIRKKKLLFILGHMRSGSSLLLHLLTSNKEIAGIGELHIKYNSWTSLGKAIFKIRGLEPQLSKATYLIDKVLHSRLLPDVPFFKKMLHESSGKVLIIVRSPKKAIPSIINLRLPDISDYEQAADYYITELTFAQSVANQLPAENVMVITYEQLIDDDVATLHKISQFLALQRPLSSEYEVGDKSGKKGLGDPSQNIRSGKILKESQKQSTAEGAEFSEAHFLKAQSKYQEICNTLIS